MYGSQAPNAASVTKYVAITATVTGATDEPQIFKWTPTIRTNDSHSVTVSGKVRIAEIR